MPTRLLVALLGAVLVFFGATRVASAAVAVAGTWAAAHGAPLCDGAASTYAAEPAPASDDGVMAPHLGESCRIVASLMGDRAGQSVPDDLQRTPPAVREVAVLPPSVAVSPGSYELPGYERAVIDGTQDGYSPTDNPPPRPVPWRA